LRLLKKIIADNRGVALVTMMLLLSALTLLAVGAVMVSNLNLQLSSNYYQNSRAFYAAEAGVEKALSDVQTILDGQGRITNEDLATITPPALDDFSFEQFTLVRSDSSYVDTVDSGPYMGMVSLNQPIDITSKVIGPNNSRYHIVVSVEGLQIPIFQFGVFYNDSLEVHNGANMDFFGRVHTNSSLFVGCPNGVFTNFHRNITVAGDLYWFKITGPDYNRQGTIRIKLPGPDSTLVSLTHDTRDYIGNDAGWVDYTNTTFKGRLRTRAHNITPLGMPIPREINPIEIIKRRQAGDGPALRTERLDWKADTRIYSNASLSTIQIMNNAGNPKVLTDPTALTTAYNAFYDDRENKWVDFLVLNVSRLTAADIGNGIVYISIVEQAGRRKGIKLISGATLPGPMTICSDNAVYIKGDYNTVNWRPSAVMADAVNLLSNSWIDANNPQNTNNANAASNTQYFVALIAGDTPTSFTQYNGGLENFPRFLENWSGRTCMIVGSFINLYLSDYATGAWVYGGRVYEAPTRNWQFDVRFLDFNQLPPGTPSVGSVLRIAFRQEFFE
jgi:hypothetical protein